MKPDTIRQNVDFTMTGDGIPDEQIEEQLDRMAMDMAKYNEKYGENLCFDRVEWKRLLREMADELMARAVQ